MIRSSLSVLFAILFVFSGKYEGVNGQGPVQQWLEVGREVAEDLVGLLGDVPIPFINNFPAPGAQPAAPAPAPAPPAQTNTPTPRIVLINGKYYLTFDTAAAPSPAPAPRPRPIPAPRDPLDAIEHPLLTLYNILNPPPAGMRPNVQQVIVPFGRPSPSPSPSPLPLPIPHPGPCHNNCGCGSGSPNKPCKPERVRIVVVDDCNDKKSSSDESSSGSDESKSQEVDVVVPREGRKTIHYRVRN